MIRNIFNGRIMFMFSHLTPHIKSEKGRSINFSCLVSKKGFNFISRMWKDENTKIYKILNVQLGQQDISFQSHITPRAGGENY